MLVLRRMESGVDDIVEVVPTNFIPTQNTEHGFSVKLIPRKALWPLSYLEVCALRRHVVAIVRVQRRRRKPVFGGEGLPDVHGAGSTGKACCRDPGRLLLALYARRRTPGRGGRSADSVLNVKCSTAFGK